MERLDKQQSKPPRYRRPESAMSKISILEFPSDYTLATVLKAFKLNEPRIFEPKTWSEIASERLNSPASGETVQLEGSKNWSAKWTSKLDPLSIRTKLHKIDLPPSIHSSRDTDTESVDCLIELTFSRYPAGMFQSKASKESVMPARLTAKLGDWRTKISEGMERQLKDTFLNWNP
jgi:hypothetical protein